MYLASLVESDGDDLLHAVLDHLRGEEVGLALAVDGDLAHVLQQDRRDRLRRLGHVDRTVVADLSVERFDATQLWQYVVVKWDRF